MATKVLSTAASATTTGGSSNNTTTIVSATTTATATTGAATAASSQQLLSSKPIPIVCPGHTRPLAELQFCSTTISTTTSSTTSALDSANNNNNNEESLLLLLLSACHDRIPMMRNGTTGDWMGSLIGHKGAVWCCRMDTWTQTMIATASGDFSCRIYDAITGQCIYTLMDAKHIIKTCDFNPISTLLATAGHEGIVRIYNLIEQEQRFFAPDNNNNNKKPKETSKTNVTPIEIRVQPLVSSSDTTTTATSTSSSSSSSKITIGKLNWYNDTIFIIGCSDGTIRFYDVTTCTTTDNNNNKNDPPEYPSPLHILSTTTSTTDTSTTTSTNNEIRDMELQQITPPPSSSSSSGTTSTPYLALTIAAGKTIYIYDITDLQQIQLRVQYTLPNINFYNEGGISLHPSGTKFIVGGSDLYVYLYSINTESSNNANDVVVTQLDCYKGHHGPIRCLRYSPDGTTFASGSEDGTIRLWQPSLP